MTTRDPAENNQIFKIMAANMMEILKQIQRNQQDCMRDLHIINDKFGVIERKINDLDNKVNQQQVLETVGRLEEQIKRNNMLMFGNVEAEINSEDRDANTDSCQNNVEPGQVMGPAEIHLSDNEAGHLENHSNVAVVEENDENLQQANRGNDVLHINDNDEEDKTGEFSFIEIQDIDENSITSIDEAAANSVYNCDTLDMSPETNFLSEQINKLNIKLNRMTAMFQADFRDMEELIMDIVTEVKISIEDTLNAVCNQNDELISQTCAGVNELKKQELSTITEMRKLAKDISKLSNVKLAEEGNRIRGKKTIRISPTYFSEDQISKLNDELKRISEIYQDTNIYPVIEVIPVGEHPIIKQLDEGVYYEKINSSSDSLMFHLKLGVDGLERTDVKDLLNDYPELSFNDVVIAFLKTTNEWERNSEIYDFTKPMVYNKYGNLLALRL